MYKTHSAALKKAINEQFKPGDTAFLVHSNRFVREVTVTHVDCYGMCSVRFSDAFGGIRVRITRLFQTKEEAELHMSVHHRTSLPS